MAFVRIHRAKLLCLLGIVPCFALDSEGPLSLRSAPAQLPRGWIAQAGLFDSRVLQKVLAFLR